LPDGWKLFRMFSKVALISIPVSDQQKAKKFYVAILGCHVVEEMPFDFGEDKTTKWIRFVS
jgi:catechol 2,3-dioxygenase-like lactoylglutathione lyase family enzyme